MEAELQGTPEDGSEKVMVEEPLAAPGGQGYPLKDGSERLRNTAREKTKSHNVRTANTFG
jgi:hypothetical protein